MAKWKFGKLGNHEYGIVNLFIAVTTIVWFATGIMYTYGQEPLLAELVFGATIIGSLVILSLVAYEKIKKVKPSTKYEDERSDVCSMKATRNAFITVLVALAAYMIIGQWASDSLYRIQALQGVFGVSVAAYVISWSYYMGVD
jgi:1,4-dihydroxy-2-naphthoate octaprenyltransferase